MKTKSFIGMAYNISIDVITRKLIKRTNTGYQYFSVILFVLFIASMTFIIYYNVLFLPVVIKARPSLSHSVFAG